MRKVVYAPHLDRLVYLYEKATPEFWDAMWEKEGAASEVDPVFARVTRQHLPPGSKVLEGGCGRADKVKALSDAGFQSVGVDFAERTVEQARRQYPGLDVRKGDVRALDFPDGSLDGYWSIGVIEHFWSGYDEILAESARVLRPGGILFLTAPWFSPYRYSKLRRGGYPAIPSGDEPEGFYQFALSREEVTRKLAQHGFDVRRWSGVACEISMMEDMTRFHGAFQWLFESRGNLAKRVLRRSLVEALNRYCGHSFMAIAQRRGTN
jgi:SAM-dependent methyltransferase